MKITPIVFIWLSTCFYCKAQQGAGVFASPQMTFFNSYKTVNLDKNYFLFDNPQADVRAGIFGCAGLKNDWFLNFVVSAGSKTFKLENFTKDIFYPSIEAGIAQTISDYQLEICISKRILMRNWDFYPFTAISYSFNSFSEISNAGYTSKNSSSDTLTYNPEKSFRLGDNYSSIGLGVGATIGNRQFLKRFRFRVRYSFEFTLLPPEYYSIKAAQGSDSIDQIAKLEGQFSYLNFDIMFYILKSKRALSF